MNDCLECAKAAQLDAHWMGTACLAGSTGSDIGCTVTCTAAAHDAGPCVVRRGQRQAMTGLSIGGRLVEHDVRS